MKKLMIAAVVACTAAFAQAAAISWGSGYLKGPTSAQNGTVGSKLLSKIEGTWTATLLIYSDSAGKTLLASDQVTMTVTSSGFAVAQSTYDSKTKPNTAGTVATTFSTPAGMKVTSAKWSNLADGQGYYYKIIVKGDTADYTAEKVSAVTAFSTSSSPSTPGKINFDNTTKLGSEYTDAAWTVTAKSVPEPTSAMLLLLGMAGLALRRRRA